MASAFHGAVDAHVAILGAQCGPGGVMNFNVGAGEKKHKPEPFSTVPFAPDPDFVDRPEITAWLRDKCAGAGARAALVGLGGVGKSQLALHYVHSIRDADPQTFVFWVYASTRARFEEAYRDIADRLQLPGWSDPKADVLRLVSDWLRDDASGQWVMVVDNADDIDTFGQRVKVDSSVQMSLATFLPQNRGLILVTSRNKDAAFELVGGYNRIKEVTAMNEGEGLQLLSNKLLDPPGRESALKLLRELDCIPLAINQAAAYIGRRAGMTVSRYVDEFRKSSKKRESLLRWDAGDLRRDANASNSVVTTWQISFEQIQREQPSAVGLLALMSFFNAQGIPKSTLRKSYHMGTDEADDHIDDAFERDLDTLQAFSFVTMIAKAETYEMHALVQFCTRVWLTSVDDIAQWKICFMLLLNEELSSTEYRDYARYQLLLSHVEPLYNSEPMTESARILWAELLTAAALHLCCQGRYDTAREISEKCILVGKKTSKPGNETTMINLGALAFAQRSQSEFKEAEELYQTSLAGLIAQLGECHRFTLLLASQRIVMFQERGRYSEAETLGQWILARQKEQLGEEHVEVFITMRHVAQALYSQGKCEEAVDLAQQVLTGLTKELGDDHFITMTSAGVVAMIFHGQGKHKQAEELNRRALAYHKKELGEHNSDTLVLMIGIALQSQERGRYKDAEVLYRQVLEGCQKLGEHHPITFACRGNLAVTLQRQERYIEAEELHEQSLLARIKILGAYHHDTLNGGWALAALWYRMRCYKQAGPLYRAVLRGMVKYLGLDHAATFGCFYEFAAFAMEMQDEWMKTSSLRRDPEDWNDLGRNYAVLKEVVAQGVEERKPWVMLWKGFLGERKPWLGVRS